MLSNICTLLNVRKDISHFQRIFSQRIGTIYETIEKIQGGASMIWYITAIAAGGSFQAG